MPCLGGNVRGEGGNIDLRFVIVSEERQLRNHLSDQAKDLARMTLEYVTKRQLLEDRTTRRIDPARTSRRAHSSALLTGRENA